MENRLVLLVWFIIELARIVCSAIYGIPSMHTGPLSSGTFLTRPGRYIKSLTSIRDEVGITLTLLA